VRLRTILDPGSVVLDVGTGSKKDVLERLVTPILARRTDLDGPAILAELVGREIESSTAIADGIAIPHARPDIRTVTAAFGLSREGIAFDSLDGRPTQLLFVLLSPATDSQIHVRWLSHIARVLADSPTRARLLDATSSEEVLAVFEEREDAIEMHDREAARAALKGAS
jgi:mannitol/fructose-specific phosphotransferase system IIA component (Ntr-type)